VKTGMKRGLRARRRRKPRPAPTAAAPLKLDLACGQSKQTGFTGVDIAAVAGVDVVHDLLITPWPFADESVEEIFCSHFIEHIPMPCAACSNGQQDPFFLFFDELWRVLKVGSKALMIAPYYKSARAWQDPTHRRAINEWTFLYMNEEWRRQNRLDHYKVRANFNFSYGYSFSPDWAARAEEARGFALRHYMDVVMDIHTTLEKIPLLPTAAPTPEP